jgi:EAL domain-containing protein (putative c-di-GMP-specific phosphodiesterase class I)
MMIETTRPRINTAMDGAGGAGDGGRPVNAEQAVEIVGLAARLIRLKSRIGDLTALGEFAVTLMGEMEEALERDAFCYFYQPILSASSGLIEGYEALIRWRRGTEAVAPALFLPIAEETGAIRAIQQRLLDDVALASSKLAAPTFISINWSPRQFLKASAVSALIDRVAELKLDPSRLIIEITARSGMVDPDLVYFCVQLLKETGFQIGLDDFGGRYGSLAYVSRLPIDFIKLDPSLIAEVERSERAAGILGGVVDFAHQLGHRVIAKGIETQSQVRILRRLGCDLLQGHAIGSPAREPRLIKAYG